MKPFILKTLTVLSFFFVSNAMAQTASPQKILANSAAVAEAPVKNQIGAKPDVNSRCWTGGRSSGCFGDKQIDNSEAPLRQAGPDAEKCWTGARSSGCAGDTKN